MKIDKQKILQKMIRDIDPIIGKFLEAGEDKSEEKPEDTDEEEKTKEPKE
jgi:hypothetical protein